MQVCRSNLLNFTVCRSKIKFKAVTCCCVHIQRSMQVIQVSSSYTKKANNTAFWQLIHLFQPRYRSNTPSLPSTKPFLSSRNLHPTGIRNVMFMQHLQTHGSIHPGNGCLLDGVEVGSDVVSSLVTHPALPSVCGLEQNAAPTSSPSLILHAVNCTIDI